VRVIKEHLIFARRLGRVYYLTRRKLGLLVYG
jgi:hypothetical protein